MKESESDFLIKNCYKIINEKNIEKYIKGN